MNQENHLKILDSLYSDHFMKIDTTQEDKKRNQRY